MTHDPERLGSELLQCLRQDKKHLGLLLGAGCPSSMQDGVGQPLIPGIAGLTEVVRARVCDGSCALAWEETCRQLMEGGGNPPNIEAVLTRVRGLRDYVGSSTINGLNQQTLKELEESICKEIVTCVSKQLPHRSTPYHNLAGWIGATPREEPVEIFTTNYDLLSEEAFEDMRVPFFDGFVGARQPFFDPHAIEFDRLPARWARLWKIHGSINWRSGTVNGEFAVWRTDAQGGGDVVIHPSHLKYEQSRKMPYLAMMDRLRQFLNTPSSALVVIGYSFGDQHLNDLIIQGSQGIPIFALMYGRLDDYAHAVDLACKRPNLSLIAADGAVVGTKKALWEESSEEPTSNLPRGTIEWEKQSGASDRWQAHFGLGDFARFGSLLQEISGTRDVGR